MFMCYRQNISIKCDICECIFLTCSDGQNILFTYLYKKKNGNFFLINILSLLSIGYVCVCVYVYWVWFTFLNIFPYNTGTFCRLLPGRNMFKQVIWTSLDVGSGLFQCSIQICLLQGHFSNFYYIVAVLSLFFSCLFDVHK